MLITGEVPRTTDFEQGFAIHQALRNGSWEPDPLILDDQALVVHLAGRGLVVVTGCGHAGVVNIVRYARALTGVEQVHAVLGGFHLTGALFEPVIGRPSRRWASWRRTWSCRRTAPAAGHARAGQRAARSSPTASAPASNSPPPTGRDFGPPRIPAQPTIQSMAITPEPQLGRWGTRPLALTSKMLTCDYLAPDDWGTAIDR